MLSRRKTAMQVSVNKEMSVHALHLIVVVLTATTLASAQLKLSPSAILRENRGITVPLGRSVYINPNDLHIRVSPGDTCVVSVLDNDPLSERPGKVMPSRFPCDFDLQDVKYSHFGSRSPSEDRIRLQIRYDSPTETIIIPFTITVEVSFVQLEIITRNLPVEVPDLMGVSQPIDGSVLEFNFDRDTDLCKVSVLSKASGLPRYGVVMNETSLLQMVDCDRFLNMGVRYKHTAETDSPDRDFIPFVVEVMGQDGSLYKQEYFQVMARIRGGVENTRPQPSYNAMLVMEVDQFVMTAITSEILAAEDFESSPEKLIFNITTPLGPGEGHIVSTDDRNKPIGSFYQGDIEDLRIAYKPPADDSDIQRVYQVGLEVVDPEGLTSDPFMLMILVKPMNTLAPVVTRNTGIQLFEGQSRTLKSDDNLQISDENDLENVKVFVADGLRHGHLRLPNGQKFFTPADLDAGKVIYEHDDSDTHSDNIIFRMTDGKNNVEFLFPISVYPEDDQPPILNVNTGMEIRKQELAEISPFALSATDIDSDDSSILFTLQEPLSEEGVILRRQLQTPNDIENWHLINGMYEQVTDIFTQQEILDGKIYYRHIGPHRSDFVIDKIRLKVSDDGDPPNESEAEEFVIKIAPVDDQLPFMYPNIRLQMEIDEFQLTSFKRKYLRYTDDDTDDRKLRYQVNVLPYDTDDNSPLGVGGIVMCEQPSEAVAVFTQSQVNHHKICYQPPSSELGITPRIIQFMFSVEDMSGNLLPDQRFTILLNPVDNKPPEITNGRIVVFENGFTVITPDIMDAKDPDTKDSDLKFTVVEQPTHGTLQLDEEILEVNDLFHKLDISEGRLTYFNTGDEMEEDLFKIDVSDGIHHVPITFKIKVKSVDDEAPSLLGVQSGVLELSLDVPENSAVTLKADDIKASDPDTDDMMLTFMLEKAPYEGVILVAGEQTDHFTQKNIIDGSVQYRHTGGEVGTKGRNDSFAVIVTDMSDDFIVGGNKIDKLIVNMKIIPVDSEPPIVSLGAPFEVRESDKGPVLPIHLDATDIDTDDIDIMCTIIAQPTNGYVENSSPAPGSEKPRIGIPISAFTIGDIRFGHINYVQSVHKGVEPREDQFMFRCSDGLNNSPSFRFTITIFPTNDEEPEVFLREFMVLEGMELMIDLPILNVVDRDDPADDLVFTIIQKPKHGHIVQQRPEGTYSVERFTIDDISQPSTIGYEHDDSETTKDVFKFHLSDGLHNITKTVQIIVIPVDDETPRLTINNGLELDKGGEIVTITNEHLKAEDLDSNDPDLVFIMRRLPKYGYIQKTVKNQIWNLTLGQNFTQKNIDNRLIQYVHTGLEGVRDLVKFDVTDGLNFLIDRYFYITVEGIDMTFPTVINKGVELPEGGMVTLTTDLLSGTDLDSPDENLQFIVTRAPNRGQLELTDGPGVPITSFTQMQLAGNKVRYVHHSEDEMKMDSFEFEVTDGFNPVARTFRISLSDVDNKKPVVTFETLRLKEGENKLITPFELNAEDRDTPDEDVVFTVTQVPVHGSLLFNSTQVVSKFSMGDLNDNLITYRHDGSETLSDSFSFTVTDGTHTDFYVLPETAHTTRRPQMMMIHIVAVDNGVPQISVNRGASALRVMDGGGGGLGFPLSDSVLRVEDRDSPDDSLHYTLTIEPVHGYIINTAIGNKSISEWTQGDINRRQIEYILRIGENATSDSFFFKIADKGGNVLANQPFHLNWAWISLESNKIFCNETSEKLEVTLRRRGYLGETSFVTITAVNGTAKVGEDVASRYAKQVQFNPGQTEKTWKIEIQDDSKFERSETFELKLTEPVMGALEYPDIAIVTITDIEDESTVFIEEKEYRVAEDIGEILIPIKRTGDLSDELMVICSTLQDTAMGTRPSTVTSFSDYITRPEDHRSVIRFDKGEVEKYCRVTVIDDSLYEDEEQFTVTLTEPMGGQVGEVNVSRVIIEPDKNDDPAVYFGESQYSVDESDGFVEVKVWRTGTDLSKPSSVTVRSRRTDPKSAEAGLDYIAVNKILDFAPGVTMQTVRITILDDLGRPRVEGLETFQVVLRMPMGAIMGEPSSAVITINDTVSDVPTMQFKAAEYEGFENDGLVKAFVVRSGDSSQISTVRCYTRQATAEVAVDYVERPDTNDSVITFLPGEYEQVCAVKLVNDSRFEDEEVFRLVLGSPASPSMGLAKVGPRNVTKVKILDDGDKPVITFERTKYVIKEPMFKEETSILRLPVVREGDVSEEATVTVNTRDGSAYAGKDYNGIFKEIKFGKNESRKDVSIEILYDGQKEMREVFTVHLRSRRGFADIKVSKVLVYIEERVKVADVTFPSRPIVLSLRDYDDADQASEHPIQGYPVVCVTPCNPKHPDFSKTGELCTAQGINDTKTLFRWRVSAPTGPDGVTSDLHDVTSNTFFASTKTITLDSIYFSSGSRIQCGARAVNTEGDPGLELLSETVAVDRDTGICEPRVLESVGAEPFVARVRYTGPDDPDHPNKVKVTVTIPHRDGMLPVVSTRQLSNFELTLSKDGTRLATHRCSNLLDFDEHDTQFGFITNTTKNPNVIGETEPYQYSSQLRTKPTLRFYKNLNLDACLWEFVSYFDMSELTTECGGTINTDGQVLDLKQSYVSMQVPIYVSYVFHSPVATGGWMHYDMNSQLQLTFVYDTAILWQNGISSPEGEAGLQGYLYPTSMRIREDDRLSVSFRSEARFRGQFVLSHPGTSLESMVTSPDHPALTFTLDLMRTEPTFEQPEQLWEFVSDYAVRDYSGMYNIKLIPCTTPLDQEYSLPVTCNPRNPLNFDLPIRFQQVSDPVPTRFSLNTDFHLMRKRALWLGDGSMGFGDGTDAAFTPTDTLYGRVNVDPVQNLGESFVVTVEKVFLCSGKDGYIPKYDPKNKEFGCVAESPNLQYAFKILDKGAPFTEKKDFREIPFNAKLASDDVDAVELVKQTGSDGFSMDCQPLFDVDGGRQWFLHTIYTIRSRSNADRGIGKRSVGVAELYHDLSASGLRVERGLSASGFRVRPAELYHDLSASDLRVERDLSASGLRVERDLSASGLRVESDLSASGLRVERDLSASGLRVERDLSASGLRVERDLSASSLRVRRAERDLQGIGQKGKGTNMARINLKFDSQYSVDVGTNPSEGGFPLVPVLVAIGVLLVVSLFVMVIFVRRRRKQAAPPPSPTNTIIVANGKGSSKIVAAGHYNDDNTEV